MILECPYCGDEMEYMGIEERPEGRNEVYECPTCGEQMRRWIIEEIDDGTMVQDV